MSFNNFVVEFPGSSLREKVLYFKFDSAYQLAINSVKFQDAGQNDRRYAMTYYNSFLKVLQRSLSLSMT